MPFRIPPNICCSASWEAHLYKNWRNSSVRNPPILEQPKFRWRNPTCIEPMLKSGGVILAHRLQFRTISWNFANKKSILIKFIPPEIRYFIYRWDLSTWNPFIPYIGGISPPEIRSSLYRWDPVKSTPYRAALSGLDQVRCGQTGFLFFFFGYRQDSLQLVS